MVERQDSTAVERALERLRVALAGDVLEHLVDGIAPLEHRVVLAPRADQMGQGKLFAREE